MAKQLMNPRKNGWTFVMKFKVCKADRSIEAIKVINAPAWGPAFLAFLLVLGSVSVFYAYKYPPLGDAVAAGMGLAPEPQTPVMAQLEEARIIREYEALLAEERAEVRRVSGPDYRTDVITPLNVRDPSALVMGPGAY